MLDPTGALVVELRSDSDVATLVAGRVRTFEPLGTSATYEGDALDAKRYKAFIVLTPLSVPPHPRLPITDAEFAVRCYGATPQNAWAVYGAVVKAVHGVGARVKSSGLGIYRSWAVTGGGEDKDPDTKQPLVAATIRIIATAQVVT